MDGDRLVVGVCVGRALALGCGDVDGRALGWKLGDTEGSRLGSRVGTEVCRGETVGTAARMSVGQALVSSPMLILITSGSSSFPLICSQT